MLKNVSFSYRMSGVLAMMSLLFSSLPGHAQYCTPTLDCGLEIDLNTFVLNGENSTGFNDVNTGCSAGGYDDRTAQAAVELLQGGAYTATVAVGDVIQFDTYCAIWIDLNDNDTFEVSDKVAAYNNGLTTAGSAVPIAIPASAAPGNHRMRVMIAFQLGTNFDQLTADDFDPCPTSDFSQIGEVHDYSIRILSSPLPVEMSSLKGVLTGGSTVRLSWTTFKEQNNKGFAVRRSDNGKDFYDIGFVASNAKNGNSTQALSYTFNDTKIVTGAAYYRLEQADGDGKTSFSNVIRLAPKESAAFTLIAMPNPVTDMLTLHAKGVPGDRAVITITDMAGKLLRVIPAGGSKTMISMKDLPAGLFFVKYADAERSQTIKVNKQ